jgi:hypothetical protein
MHRFVELLASETLRRVIWGLVPRGIGLTFLVAYASLWRQIIPILGSRGIDPVSLQFKRIREDFPLLARLRIQPSLLWIAHSDRALQLYVAAGMLTSCGIMLGGPFAWACNLYCWAMWLSLQFSLRLNYPWDTLLLESGFLCLFLPRTELLPGLAVVSAVHPLLPFIFQLAIFRVLFGFGKTKFLGIRRGDLCYTRFFLMNMPLCTPLGWRFARLPDAVHKLTLAGIAFVELVAPFLVLVPGPARLVGAIAILGQMLGIQLTGNFGYFNLLTAALCVSLLDIKSSLLTGLAQPADLITIAHLPFTVVAAYIVLATPVYLIFNSWFNYGFLYWPAFERLPHGPLRAWLALLRMFEPLRIVNTYGVFRASPAPPLRWVTVVEGSNDGVTWEKYRYRFTQTDEHSRPRFVAPHHPRLDHHTFYDAVGIDGTGYLHSVSLANPYLFTPSSVLDRTMQRLLDRGAPAAALFSTSPFADTPPKFARAALYRFTPNDRATQAQTGHHWSVMPVGLHLAPTEQDAEVWQRWMPPPELFHSEAAYWRRRARTCCGVEGKDLAVFWDDFLPFVKQAARDHSADDPFSWSALPSLQRALRQRYTRGEVRRFQLTLGRLAMVLMVRLEAIFSRPALHFMRDVAGLQKRRRPVLDPFNAPPEADAEEIWQALAAWPHGPLRSRFHLGLAVQSIILDGGREGWALLAGADAQVPGTGKPIRTVATLSRQGRRSMAAAAAELGLALEALLPYALGLSIARGMFLEGVVNYDMVARQAGRLRVLYSSEDGYIPPATGLVPGVVDLIGELRDQPALCMMYGWGQQTRTLTVVDPPRMVFGHDDVWREASRAAVPFGAA